ncbi:hypothetical protein [Nocardioides nanhaiensis]
MTMILRLHEVALRWVLVSLPALLGSIARVRRRRDERGDVPGWVFVAVMSVGLVTAIGAIAGDELQRMLRQALRSVG